VTLAWAIKGTVDESVLTFAPRQAGVERARLIINAFLVLFTVGFGTVFHRLEHATTQSTHIGGTGVVIIAVRSIYTLTFGFAVRRIHGRKDTATGSTLVTLVVSAAVVVVAIPSLVETEFLNHRGLYFYTLVAEALIGGFAVIVHIACSAFAGAGSVCFKDALACERVAEVKRAWVIVVAFDNRMETLIGTAIALVNGTWVNVIAIGFILTARVTVR